MHQVGNSVLAFFSLMFYPLVISLNDVYITLRRCCIYRKNECAVRLSIHPSSTSLPYGVSIQQHITLPPRKSHAATGLHCYKAHCTYHPSIHAVVHSLLLLDYPHTTNIIRLPIASIPSCPCKCMSKEYKNELNLFIENFYIPF